MISIAPGPGIGLRCQFIIPHSEFIIFLQDDFGADEGFDPRFAGGLPEAGGAREGVAVDESDGGEVELDRAVDEVFGLGCAFEEGEGRGAVEFGVVHGSGLIAVEPRGRKGRKDIATSHFEPQRAQRTQRHRNASRVVWAAESAAVFDRRHRDGVCPIRTRVFVPVTHRPDPLCSEHSGSACVVPGLYPFVFWKVVGRQAGMPAPQFRRAMLWSRLPACLMDGVPNRVILSGAHSLKVTSRGGDLCSLCLCGEVTYATGFRRPSSGAGTETGQGIHIVNIGVNRA